VLQCENLSLGVGDNRYLKVRSTGEKRHVTGENLIIIIIRQQTLQHVPKLEPIMESTSAKRRNYS
jgi:hypothetical protein